MSLSATIISDPHIDYMIIEGAKYARGTIFEFDDYWQNKYGDKYGMYDGTDCFFFYHDNDLNKIGGRDWRNPFDPFENHIAKIITPILWQKADLVKAQLDTQNDNMFYAWILYIFAMLVSTIFNGQIFLWAGWTYVFYKYRKEQLYITRNHAERWNRKIYE